MPSPQKSTRLPQPLTILQEVAAGEPGRRVDEDTARQVLRASAGVFRLSLAALERTADSLEELLPEDAMDRWEVGGPETVAMVLSTYAGSVLQCAYDTLEGIGHEVDRLEWAADVTEEELLGQWQQQEEESARFLEQLERRRALKPEAGHLARELMAEAGPVAVGDYQTAADSLYRRMEALVEDAVTKLSPSASESSAGQQKTISEHWTEFLEFKRARRKPRTVKFLEQAYRNHVGPHFGGLLPEEITAAMVQDWHASLASTPAMANRAADRVLSALYNWMRRRGVYTGRNPCDAIEPFQERPRRRVPTKDELARIVRKLDQVEAKGGPRGIAASCLRLIVLTGLRRGEAVELRWSEVGDGFLEFESKTGDITRRIGPRAAGLIDGMPRDSDRVFPVCLATVLRVWRDARKAAGCEDLTIHDLRRGFSTRLAEDGVPPADVAALMGQTTSVNVRHYRHLSPARMQEIGNQAEDLMASRDDDRGSVTTGF